MDKEAQDRLWNELSEESRDEIKKEYNVTDLSYCGTNKLLLEKLFGTHNLNPKPPTPKTWEDVEELRLSDNDIFHKEWNEKIGWKMFATERIAKLIELGYGGMVSEEEWKDDSKEKFKIIPFKEGGFQVVRYYSIQHKDILSFRDRKIAEEFMSYESNRRLVEQYYMM